jgi:hypothetical protein
MFGKNKKNKKTQDTKNSKDNVSMHTMQDDLDLNIGKNSMDQIDASDDASSVKQKNNSPFLTNKQNNQPKETELGRSLEKKIDEDKLGSNRDFGNTKDPHSRGFQESAVDLNKKHISDDKQNRAKSVPSTPSENDLKKNNYQMPKSAKNITVGVEDNSIGLGNNSLPEKSKVDSESDSNSDGGKNIEITDKSSFGRKRNRFAQIIPFIFLILIGVAAYFGWIYYTKDSYVEKPVVTEEEVNPEEDIFSKEVNLITISKENINKQSIREAFDEKFIKMDNLGYDLLEFSLVSESNNPFTLDLFTEVMGIDLGYLDKNNLSGDFSIYLYKKGDIERVGILLGVLDPVFAYEDMKKEEDLLVKSLNPLFELSVTEEEVSDQPFSSSTYKDINIRYLNMNENTSIDYATIGHLLMIATNKESGRMIIDRVLNGIIGSAIIGDDMGAAPENEESRDILHKSVSINDNGGDGETIITP